MELKLNTEELRVILEGLNELPFKKVVLLYNKLLVEYNNLMEQSKNINKEN